MNEHDIEGEAKRKLEAARAELARLIQERDIRTSIPANERRDTDMLIGAALDMIPELLEIMKQHTEWFQETLSRALWCNHEWRRGHDLDIEYDMCEKCNLYRHHPKDGEA